MDQNVREELAHLEDVPLLLEAKIPCVHLTVSDILALEPGAVITTGRAAGESVEFAVGGQVIAQAELIVIDDSLAARLSDFGEKI